MSKHQLKTEPYSFFSLAFGYEGNLLSINGGLPVNEALETADLSLSQAMAILYSFEPDEECCMSMMGAAINQVELARAIITSVVDGVMKGGKS